MFDRKILYSDCKAASHIKHKNSKVCLPKNINDYKKL